MMLTDTTTDIPQKTILLFEDSDDNRLLMCHFLKTKSVTIHEYNNGKIAKEELDRLSPDLLLVDWRMPEVGGQELLELLSESRPDLLSRTVVLTGAAEDGDVQQWSSLVLRVLPKPCPWPELLRLVDEV